MTSPPLLLSTQAMFRAQFISRDFTPEDFSAFYHLLEPRRFEAGETLMREGEPIREMLFLESGAVAVTRRSAVGGTELRLCTLEGDAVFGDLSFIDDRPADATVRALKPCRAMALGFAEARAHALHDRLVTNVARHCAGRLRSTNVRFVQSLVERLEEERERNSYGNLFIATILIAGVSKLTFDYRQLEFHWMVLYSWGFLLLFLAPFLVWVYRHQVPWSALGLTWRGARRSILESLGIAAVAAPVILLYRHLAHPEESLFAVDMLRQKGSLFAIEAALYVGHSFVQELIGRGILQGALARFMRERHWMMPILAVSFAFGVLHLMFGVVPALLIGGVGVLFGVTYHRHGTLVGVTLLHWILGMVCKLTGII